MPGLKLYRARIEQISTVTFRAPSHEDAWDAVWVHLEKNGVSELNLRDTRARLLSVSELFASINPDASG